MLNSRFRWVLIVGLLVTSACSATSGDEQQSASIASKVVAPAQDANQPAEAPAPPLAPCIPPSPPSPTPSQSHDGPSICLVKFLKAGPTEGMILTVMNAADECIAHAKNNFDGNNGQEPIAAYFVPLGDFGVQGADIHEVVAKLGIGDGDLAVKIMASYTPVATFK